jgi:hypothetical protein
MQSLGEQPPRINVRNNDSAHRAGGAHTIEHHGADIPLRRSDNPGGKSIEGRIHGDPPWSEPVNTSFRWTSDAVMNQVVNDYIRNNWERIRLDVAVNGKHANAFDAGTLVGEGFVNAGMGGAGPRQAAYAQTSLVRIIVNVDPGPPAGIFVYTTFPNYLGTPAY